jgi:Domain of unknown function (DUF222)
LKPSEESNTIEHVFDVEGFAWHPTPGVALDAILTADPSGLGEEECLAQMAVLEKLVASAQAAQMRRCARFVELRPGRKDHNLYDEFAADELACALHITGNAAQARLDLALTLAKRLPQALKALERGDIDLYKARTLAEVAEPLTDEQAGAVEERVLARAAQQTAPQLRQSGRRAVLRIDPDGAKTRHEQRKAERRVELYPWRTAWPSLPRPLPALPATAIYDRLGTIARHADPADERGMDARRADAMVDLLLATQPGPVTDLPARVHVTVPASTLLGATEEPGDLAGHGPIPADLARQAAASGTWRRLLTDPATGALLDYGRTTYRPPADLADFTRARDTTCRFPGCRQPARKCDLDHTVHYPDGPTTPTNLGTLCRHHHRLKHKSEWSLTQDPDGVFRWTSPTGREYTTTPEPPEPPPPSPPPPDEPPPF